MNHYSIPRARSGAASRIAIASVLAAFGHVTVAAQASLATADSVVAAAFSGAGPGGVVLVARDGVPILQRVVGMADLELGVPIRPDNVFLIGSITKQFTAVAVLQLVEAGLVALDDDIRQHVREFPTHGRRVTIEQLLTHTSGVPNLVDSGGFEDFARQPHTTEQLLAFTGDTPLHFEPGMGFR
jgi:serine beta-lactamase-like protein LACTB